MPAIKASNIYKIFGRHTKPGVGRLMGGESREDLAKDGLTAAVIDASFEVEEGEMFVVMGLSGSGKSTLIRAVNGLQEPTSGSVEIYGEDITHASSTDVRRLRRERISMVFQHFALFPHRTVLDNVAYGLKIQGVAKDERRSRAMTALEMCGLEGWQAKLPTQLSGGMQQRVGLARALAADTDILLMDEAFSALDPLIRREMQDQLIELQHRLHTTLLFITHDLNEAMRIGDRIAMMRDGRIVQIGTSEEILTNPANDYVARFTEDVDRSRVLTSSSVMEPPVALLGSEQGPRAAHRLMREHQLDSLFVVDRDKHLRGVLYEADVARAVDERRDSIDGILDGQVSCVAAETFVADLFSDSAISKAPLAVVDDERRLLGVIPRVTLLNALIRTNAPETALGATSIEPGLDVAATQEVRS
ncbi:quaternary amine ABC transporter ATP-binding protein [Leekyejoonella antrihumi]|uniref:Glycine betaine/L-proline ABC transporter ATP-binding protein n=1 Tax=Leekyejoonella antrihumi TaxID=1660198 RepID=A0A563DRR5_9MICO|nr:glycine betaine/L-proline ABC transporter ATP-binding protein [Leekyejoonella antrihumi]TWP32632.1 glycine betaine/L-proline ABC transporter ATP-binding protein [Leekyejoonella antrihumi]